MVLEHEQTDHNETEQSPNRPIYGNTEFAKCKYCAKPMEKKKIICPFFFSDSPNMIKQQLYP